MSGTRVCSTPDCPNLTRGGRCDDCRRAADQRRGTARERGYTSRGHRHFRAAVLRRDPICVMCGVAVATVADLYPDSRRDLLERGLDPNDPARGRGLCRSCHSTHTAHAQPGGWQATPR
jgi:5-methylcytosine-specific restriction protein A